MARSHGITTGLDKGIDLFTIKEMMEDRYGVHTDIYKRHNNWTGKEDTILRYQCKAFAIYIEIGFTLGLHPMKFVSIRYEDLKTLVLDGLGLFETNKEIIEALDKYLTPIHVQLSLF